MILDNLLTTYWQEFKELFKSDSFKFKSPFEFIMYFTKGIM